MSNTHIILYYNEQTDQLAIGGQSWDYMVSCTFVPFISHLSSVNLPDGGDMSIDYAEKEIAIAKTPDWIELGEF